jgi:hypothetical protein
VASAVADKVQDLTSSAKEKVSQLACSVSDTAESAAESVANAYETSTEYLEDKALAARDTLTDLIRRNPIPALLIGFGVGFILARAVRD